MAKIIFVTITLLLFAAVLFLFLRKAGLQLQYLRLKKGKKPGKVSDYLSFKWSNAKEKSERWEAFLLFPMLYAVQIEDKNERLLGITKEIKRIHILIYLVLIAIIILGIYSEKVFA